ncbi:MAG: rRNA methyltransferase [Alphaproteobacteria bacterium]|nr:rRNA methyltransferase [Alphaproteobacteria bacterium]
MRHPRRDLPLLAGGHAARRRPRRARGHPAQPDRGRRGAAARRTAAAAPPPRRGRLPRGAARAVSRRGDGNRPAAVRLKKSRRFAPSSQRWLRRQLNDPYVAAAQREGYRSRAAFKLIELDERFHLLRPGLAVLDLGAAPGGWTQVAAQRVGPEGRVVAVDLKEIEAVPGAEAHVLDLHAADALERVAAWLPDRGGGGRADLVLSDMAAAATGHAATDHLRVMALAETAAEVAFAVLAPGGAFVAKVLKGGTENALLDRLKRGFARVRHAKPPASRSDSAESYVVAEGFRGDPEAAAAADARDDGLG